MQRQFFATLNKLVRPAVEAGLGSPFPCLGLGAVVVETTGRRSGRPRRVPLLAARVGDKVYTSTVRSTSLWMSNLDADENASVWLNGHKRAATATVRRGAVSVAELQLAM